MFKTRFGNKYGAKKTVYNGRKYDSKFEASVAMDLDIRLKAGDIKGFECQYKVIIPIYDSVGRKVHEVSHKVDFRIHNNDGSYTLLEAKGMDTADYLFRRKMLEKIWLPMNLDHDYEVVYQRKRGIR